MRCETGTVTSNERSYKYYQRGVGPTVLLVHGLFSNLGSMVPMAKDLIQLGFSVVLFDAPAHGEAVGTTTDPFEVRDVIRKIGGRVGTVDAVVCHSLGVLWTLAAWGQDFQARTVISIAGVASNRFLVDKFVDLHRIDSEVARGLIEALEQRFGATVWVDLSPAEIVRHIGIPGLIIHGTNDDFVPPAHAETLRASWEEARVEMVDGLGHFDIIGAPQVRGLVTGYLREL